jgi:type IV secretory pathway VirJ component
VVYSPQGTPTSFVLFLSGDGGWNHGVVEMAQQLVQQGAMVAGIDLAKLDANLLADGDQCVFPDGDLENLSHFVQAYYHLPTYLAPMLVGVASGADMAYAVLAQAPTGTFAGALTLGFCPSFNLQKPLCKSSGLDYSRGARGRGVDFLPAKSLDNPWVALQGETDRVCPAAAGRDFVAQVRGAASVMLPGVGHEFASPARWMPQYIAAFNALAARNPSTRAAPPPAALGNLPVVEIPALPGSAQSDTFAIMMSGDGGWAGLDQAVASALAADGIPVIGLDSLRYYWTARTPDGVAADTDRMIRYYLAHLGRKRVLLIGYSQGADVLPFAVNRLPAATRASVALTAILGLSEHALFEFHVSNWISDDNSGPATLPEVDRITGMPVLCIYGEDERDSLCPKLDPKKITVVKLKGGHHFDGDYSGLAREIIASAKR